MLTKERFIQKLVKLTEDDVLSWKPTQGKYTKDDSYVTEHEGAIYELKLRPEHNVFLTITLESGATGNITKVDQLRRAVLYKEYINWEIQEHIREVLGEDGIE